MKKLLLALSLFVCAIAEAEREFNRPAVLAPTTTAGTILFGDGTAAAPSIAFSSFSNTGFHRRGTALTNTLAYSASGTEIMSLTPSQLALGPANQTSGNLQVQIRPAGADPTATNIAGTALIIEAGQSTGNASGRFISFRTSSAGSSGSGANPTVPRMEILSQDVVFGNGDVSGAPAPSFIRGTNSQGVNLAANDLYIQPGRGTGLATGGSLVFRTAPAGTTGTTLNTIVERARFNPSGVFLMASGSKIDAGDSTLELPNGAALPATCVIGEIFQDTDSDDCLNTAGGDGALCICKAANTWALIANF